MTSHDPVITEDDDGCWTAACTCGWVELAAVSLRVVAEDHHDDHVRELIDHGVTG